MARGQRAASRGSWVTSRMVWPRWFSSPKSRMISSPVALSRLPVGSSASSRDGFPTSARAMATRCRWPPESSLGLWCMRFPSPTDSSAFTACSFRSLRGRPRYTSGSSTLASAVERESSWKVWKTKPISVLRRSASWSSLIVLDVVAVDPVRAARGGVERTDEVHERGLARARLPHHRHPLAAADVEGDAVEGAHLLLADLVEAGQVLDGDEGSLGHDPLASFLVLASPETLGADFSFSFSGFSVFTAFPSASSRESSL